MDIKKLAPWNWFKKEEEEAGSTVPMQRADAQLQHLEGGMANPILQLHREMDRLFDNAFRGFGLTPFKSGGLFTPLTTSGLLKPQVDIGASAQEYTIAIEVPGVDEKDVKVEVCNNTLTIKGEKKQDKEEKEKNFYRIERCYGSFQRVLSLPEDANKENIKASFKNGVLTVTMPRTALPKTEIKKIEIKSG